MIPQKLMADLGNLAARESGTRRIVVKQQSSTRRGFFQKNSRDNISEDQFNSNVPSEISNSEYGASTTTKKIPMVKTTVTLSPSPENAFVHKKMANRVSHLVGNSLSNSNLAKGGVKNLNRQDDSSFIYSSPEKELDNATTIGTGFSEKDTYDHYQISPKEETISQPKKTQPRANQKFTTSTDDITQQRDQPSETAIYDFDTSDLKLVAQTSQFDKLVAIKQPNQNNNISLRPTNRKEVAILKHTMLTLLKENGISDGTTDDYPTEMHAFLSVIQEEQKVYDTVFQEIIRQVTVNMIERERYSKLFQKIPKHVRHLHTELHRKLNKRLSDELKRAKDRVSDLVNEVALIKKHDLEVTKQAQDTHEKLVSVLTQSDNTDEILEEYHKLYKMQRDRLEKIITQTENEKRMWINASTKLAMRIGKENGVSELLQLHQFEQSRMRSANHLIQIIATTNENELRQIEAASCESRFKLISLSRSVVEEDQQNIETLGKMEKDMRLVLKNIDSNQGLDSEAEQRLLQGFQIFDVKLISTHLHKWVEFVTNVAIRFTSDKDLSLQEEVVNIRANVESWVENGLKLMKRNEKTTNGKDYVTLTETLTKVNVEIDIWLRKIEMRVSGEDGIASHVISLQNQLEDRYTTYSARDFDKPLPPSERAQLKDSFTIWVDQTAHLIKTLSNTTEKEQHRIPLHIESWLSRAIDQSTTDSDVRTEENGKVHTSLLNWMVQLLVKGANEVVNDSWDQEFHQLNQELISFNLNSLRDAGDLEMIADDKSDLRKQMLMVSDKWLTVAKKLLIAEKKRTIKLNEKVKHIYEDPFMENDGRSVGVSVVNEDEKRFKN